MGKNLFGLQEQIMLPKVWHEMLLRQAEDLASRSGLVLRAERVGDANICLIMEGPLFVASDPVTGSAFQQLFIYAQQFDVMSNGDMVRMTFHYDLCESTVL